MPCQVLFSWLKPNIFFPLWFLPPRQLSTTRHLSRSRETVLAASPVAAPGGAILHSPSQKSSSRPPELPAQTRGPAWAESGGAHNVASSKQVNVAATSARDRVKYLSIIVDRSPFIAFS